VVTVRNGINVSLLWRGVREPSTIETAIVNPQYPLIGTVGRLVPEKGLDTFVAASTIVKRRFSEARFLIVGDGPLRAELLALRSRLGLEDEVVLLGQRSYVTRIVNSLQVFVMASRTEGLPMVLLEAIALGRPVVATAVGGIPEVARHGYNTLLVPPDDPESLADAILRVLTDQELSARLGVSAIATINEEFTSDRMALETAKVFQAVLDRQ